MQLAGIILLLSLSRLRGVGLHGFIPKVEAWDSSDMSSWTRVYVSMFGGGVEVGLG